MASIFEHDDYKSFVRTHLRSLPGGGHGQYRKIAASLKMHTTLVSQVFGGERELTPEQAQLLGEYLGLNELELDFLLALVQKNRAGTEKLRHYYERKLTQLRVRATEIKSRLPVGKTLDERDRALFYSQWYYSAVRLLCSLPGCHAPEPIARQLGLPISRVREVLAFLVSVGLCEESNGRFVMTESRTHVERQSPLASRHHANWRVRALQGFEQVNDEDLVFTSPLTISRSDRARIREKILTLIEDLGKTVERSEPEELVYLGIDWLKIAPN